MASMEANLETIKTAVYGRDMRQAIYEAIAELNSGGRIDDVLEKISDAATSIANQITLSETDITDKIGAPANETVSQDIANVSSKIGIPANHTVSQDIADLSNKIDTSKNAISSKIELAKTDITDKIGTPENETVSQDIANVLDSVTAAKADILRIIGTPEVTTVVQDIWNVSGKVDTAKSVLSVLINNVSGTLGTPENETVSNDIADVSSKIDNKYSYLYTEIDVCKNIIANSIKNSKSELLTEIENVREEFQDKHDETLYELQKVKNEIVRKITAFADELAAGNGSVAGRAVLAARGAVSTSYTSAYTEGDE